MKRLTFLILYAALLVSCETLVEDFKVKKPEDKITMLGYAMADSIPAIYLTSNLGLDDQLVFPPILDANVEFLSNGTLVGTMDYTDSGWYSLDNYSFIPGNNYSLQVSASGYPAVSAEFSVPARPEMSLIDTNFIRETYPDCPDCGELYYLEFQVEFMNQPAIDEYYAVEVKQTTFCTRDEYNYCEGITVSGSRTTYLYSSAPYIETSRMFEDEYYNRNANEDAGGDALFFSDRLLDEGLNMLTFRTDIEVYGIDTTNDFWATLIFKKIDKSMFEYARSKGRNYNTDGNPFVQPVSIYSNVENGLGLVWGSSQTEYEIDLSKIIRSIDFGYDYYY